MILNFGTPQTQQPAMSGTGPTYQIQDSNPLTTHPEPGPLAPGYLHTRSSTQGRTWQTPGQGQPQKSEVVVAYNRRIHTSHRGGTHRAYSSGDRRVAGMYRITSMKGHLSKVGVVTDLPNTWNEKTNLDFPLTKYFLHISVSRLQNGLRTSLTGCHKLKGLSFFLLKWW